MDKRIYKDLVRWEEEYNGNGGGVAFDDYAGQYNDNYVSWLEQKLTSAEKLIRELNTIMCQPTKDGRSQEDGR
jgi:hypothetical protein